MTRDRDARKPRIAEPQRRQGVIRFEMPEDHFLVRGLAKVTCVALLAAIASNRLQHSDSLLA